MRRYQIGPYALAWSLLVLGVSASVAPGLQSINNQLLPVFQPSNSSGPNSLAVFDDALAQSVVVNSTGGNALTVQCSGARFGVNVDMISCQNAFGRIPDDSDGYSFMQRDRRTSLQHLLLPKRWLSLNGACAIQIALIAPNTIAHASHVQIQQAAQAILTKCGARNPPTGGVASNIGGDNHLAVVVAGTGYPNVHCNPGSAPPQRSVISVLSGIFADTNERVFGPEGAPGVDEGLPYDLASFDRVCWVNITTSGGSDRATWYDMWAHLDAIDAMCARVGHTGRADDIGENGKLEMEMIHHYH